MIEIRGDKKVLITPVSAEDLKDIHIGDIVWLDGDLMTCRDVAHRRLVEYGRELPYNIKDKAIFHAGPIVRKIEGTEDDYEMVSVGPTTSMRMEKFEYEFTKLTGVRVIVGKGGMGPNTERACKEFGAIHCVFPAGCAVVAATEVERIAEHHWDELGMPETLWCNKVKEFGPLIVSIDAEGRNLFGEHKVVFNEHKEAAKQEMLDRAEVKNKWQLTPLKDFKSPRLTERMWRTAVVVLLTSLIYEYLIPGGRNPCFALIGAVYGVGSRLKRDSTMESIA